jgi:hypothetical protein
MRFLANRILFGIIFATLLGCGIDAQAATVTVDVTPTFSPASGIVDGYRAYKSCDTTAVLIGPATSRQVFSFQQDMTQPNPTVSVRAYNSAGEGTGNCSTLALTITAPGATTTTYSCALNPVSGGTCTPAP